MTQVVIKGPVGKLECRYHRSFETRAPIALVMHPHPQYGGTMHDKVTYTLYQSFIDAGFNVLRFNYRGVGQSEGTYDNGEGELMDAAICLNWLRLNNPDPHQIWLAGFSFGGWIALQLMMRRPEVHRFVVVNPPSSGDHGDYSFLAPCHTPGVILQGQQDGIVNPKASVELAQTISYPPHVHVTCDVLPGDHFFTKHLPEFKDHVKDYIEKYIHEDIPFMKMA